MTKRAYKLAALFFFTLGVGCFVCALYQWRESSAFAGGWYSIIALMALLAAGAIRLGASRKT
jgi:hypothetical protein